MGTPSELGAHRPSSLQTGTHWDGRHLACPGSRALEGSFCSILHPVRPGFVSARLLCPPLLLCLSWRRRGEGGSLPPELGQCFGQRRVRRPLLTCSAQREIARGCLCAGPTQRARLKPPLASSPTLSPFQASDALFLNQGTWSSSRRPRLAQGLLRGFPPSDPALPCPHILSLLRGTENTGSCTRILHSLNSVRLKALKESCSR